MVTKQTKNKNVVPTWLFVLLHVGFILTMIILYQAYSADNQQFAQVISSEGNSFDSCYETCERLNQQEYERCDDLADLCYNDQCQEIVDQHWNGSLEKWAQCVYQEWPSLCEHQADECFDAIPEMCLNKCAGGS